MLAVDADIDRIQRLTGFPVRLHMTSVLVSEGHTAIVTAHLQYDAAGGVRNNVFEYGVILELNGDRHFIAARLPMRLAADLDEADLLKLVVEKWGKATEHSLPRDVRRGLRLSEIKKPQLEEQVG